MNHVIGSMKHSLFFSLTLSGAALVFLANAALATSYTNTIAQMTAYISGQMTNQNVQGLSIAIVDDQDVVWTQGFGYADCERVIAADADTVYHIGSCSKAFLGTCYMQLLDQGRVDLEAPLTNYITDFSMLPRFTNSTVTIRSLLNHHSGIPGDFFNGMITTRRNDDNILWLIDYLKTDYPFRPVNERAYYCNSGFAILSEAVSRITGTNFAAVNDAMMFIPLGMDASSFLPDKPAISNRLAVAYNGLGEPQPPEILNPLGSGSMYSSANDLTKYIRMILANGQYQGQTIVSSNGINTMTTPQLTNLPLNVTDDPQGLGWDNVDDYRFRYAGKVFWKDGATWYHCAFLGISRDLKLGVAVIQNSSGSWCDTVGAEALRWAILDKTAQHWPTNTFVPTPSPVTNRPQAELDALAGLYVGGDGYNKITAETGSLTMIRNANTATPTVYSNLVPRVNGWFSAADSQNIQLAFTNLSGHDMLVGHGIDGAFEYVMPMGEHYIPGPLAEAWSGRTNRVYRMADLHPWDYFWEPGQYAPKSLRFNFKDDALLTEWMMGCFTIEPQSDILAFQRGIHFRKGGAIQVTSTNGHELLQYSSYRFLDEAAIPTMTVNTATNGAIPFVNGTQWYFFTGQTGKTYQAQMTASGQEVFVRFTDRDGNVLAAGTNGLTAWTCPSNGTYSIAVCATGVCPYSLRLVLTGRHQTQTDYDGDRKADPAIYNETDGTWKVKLSSANYYLVTTTLNGLGGPGRADASADYDGDGKSDPAVYVEENGAWVILPSTAGYAVAVILSQSFGGPGYDAVPADYDGDGFADPAVYQRNTGNWKVMLSTANYLLIDKPALLGGAGCTAVPADYDGDRKADVAVYGESNGVWAFKPSGIGYTEISMTQSLGGTGYLPVPGDFDGDGFADPAVKSAVGNEWIVMFSSADYTPTYLTLVFE